ncbi:MAG: hypothetical protein HYR73_00865 [Candidatus Eisenbacteria bacterium]|nr:hypothetical protein [Candidatus Eisenbacteria bacterium]
MPASPLLWNLAARVPVPIAGAALHRLGLSALHAGAFSAAERLFERAAERYRADLSVESLARLRVHQRIARLRARGQRDPERVVEVERQLYLLRTIESLDPPFAPIDAARLLASWAQDAPGAIARAVPARILPLERKPS